MRKLLQQIGDQLRGFIKQRDNLALVLCSPAADALPVLKILESLEEESASDLFWIYTDNFTDTGAYADAVVKAFGAKHEVVRLAMEKANMIPWPAIPPEILSNQFPAAQRLRELAAFSRQLLPVSNGGNNVWVFYPLEIASQTAFGGLMEELLRHEFPFPWCHHLRFIVRDDPSGRVLRRLLDRAPRIEWYQPDLSMDAIDRSLEAEIADESLPLAERLAPLPVMAGNDFAQARYPEAMEKYELLLRYHAPMNNLPVAAFALNGMGEVYEKMGDLERANSSYEAALIPASQGEQPVIPVFLNVVMNLANLRVQQARWAEGEAYYDMAQQLATAARNASAKISALENRGICQQKQGKSAEAVQSWNDGAAIAAQLEEVHSCRRLLGRLEQHYRETHETAKARETQEQLVGLGAPLGS